jgi:hypothetical protein
MSISPLSKAVIASALERHMDDLHAGCQLEQLAGHVDTDTIATGAEVHLSGPGGRERRELLCRFRRNARMHQQHIGRGGDLGHGREVAQRIVGRVRVQVRHDRERPGEPEQQRVAVRRLLHDELGADQAGCADPVLDDDLMAQCLGHRLRDGAAYHVDRTAGPRGRDHAYGLRRVTLCGSERAETCTECEGQPSGLHLHTKPPLVLLWMKRMPDLS